MCLSVFKSEAFRARVRARERERARNRDKQSERGTRGRESGTEGGRGEKGRGVHVLYDIFLRKAVLRHHNSKNNLF